MINTKPRNLINTVPHNVFAQDKTGTNSKIRLANPATVQNIEDLINIISVTSSVVRWVNNMLIPPKICYCSPGFNR